MQVICVYSYWDFILINREEYNCWEDSYCYAQKVAADFEEGLLML
jgi:hypothetical protein